MLNFPIGGGIIKIKTITLIILLFTLAISLSQCTFAVESTDVKFTSSQITSASNNVKNYVQTNHKLPNYVTINNTKVTMSQFLDLMTSNLQNIKSGVKSSVTLKTVNTPTVVSENTKIGSIYKSEYLSMSKSIQTTINTTGTAPSSFKNSKGRLGYPNLVYTYSKILAFYKSNNRLPNYVSINPWPFTLGWTKLSHYTYHHQTTDYTCGPSSLYMALSYYNFSKVSESWLAKAAKSNSNTGTSQNGMIAAVNAVNIKYSTNFSMTKEKFSGWNVINNYLASGIPVIVRVHSWLDTYGTHYVLITGINFQTGKIRLADPSYNGKGTFSIRDKGVSVHEVTISELQNRIEWMVNNGKATNPVMPLFKN